MGLQLRSISRWRVLILEHPAQIKKTQFFAQKYPSGRPIGQKRLIVSKCNLVLLAIISLIVMGGYYLFNAYFLSALAPMSVRENAPAKSISLTPL